MRRCKRSSDMNSIPYDMVVEIAAQLASCSSTPLIDVKAFRATCKMFRAASNDRQVGKSMAVYKEWSKHWWDKQAYLQFLVHCARSGNTHASYILGLEHVYNMKRTVSGLRHLKRAMAGGHLTAAYTLGILKFRVPATRASAMDLLNWVAAAAASSSSSGGDGVSSKSSSNNYAVEAAAATTIISGNPNIHRCRSEAVGVLRALTMKRMVPEPKWQCGRKNHRCGEIVEGSNMWLPKEELHRSFCSQECRWREEAYIFSTLV